MPKVYTKEEAIVLKKNSIKKLNSLLESFINKPTPSNENGTDYIKKAALISKWISQYTNYISFEEKFDPCRNISYQRGDILFANFGFGVGNEFGGEHYCVVLDKDSKHRSSSVTVIPLSSYKKKPIYERDVYLGNELYEKLHLKFKTNIANLKQEQANNALLLQLFKEKFNAFTQENTEYNERLHIDTELWQLRDEITKRQALVNTKLDEVERIQNELSNLKMGSVAKIEQIRTISKIRIYNPKGKNDPLYGIRFSEESMKKINAKLKELFIFSE